MSKSRVPTSKPGTLQAQWGRLAGVGNEDVLFLYGSGCERADARLLYNDLCCVRLGCKRSLLDELVARGYDLTTFKFVIRKKP